MNPYLAAVFRRPSRATVQRRSLGALFLAIVVGLLYLSILFYNHAFTKYVDVTLYAGCQPPPAADGTGTTTQGVESAADVQGLASEPMCASATSTQDASAGHELDVPADVKLRGIEVGTVTSITLAGDADRAVLHLKLDPSKTRLIPANVSAEIIPKTLFGEKYVDLVIPANPTTQDIAQGSRTIVQSATSIEAEQVFDDVLPLLQTLKPAELSTTLTNLADALQGRGNILGDNLSRTDSYFADLNPDIGNIEADQPLLEQLADTLSTAEPDIVAQLKQFTVNANTLVEKGDVFAAFLSGTQGFAQTATSIISQNEQNLVALAQVSQPTLALLQEYSGEFSCLLTGLTQQQVKLAQAFTTHGDAYGLHINLTVPADAGRHAYTAQDAPQNTAQNPSTLYPAGAAALGGPCYGLPAARTVPIQGYVPINGTPVPTPGTAGTSNPPTNASNASYASTTPQSMARVLLAPEYGVQAQDVPDLAALLMSPALSGGDVSVSSSSG